MSQIKSAVYLVLLILIISAVAWWSWHLRANPEQDVYFALIGVVKEKHIEANAQENLIVLSSPSICGADKAHSKELPTETFTNFIKANTADAEPVRLKSIEGLIPIVGWEDTKRLNKMGSATSDLRSIIFPPDERRGFVISRVGFNEKMTQAIMCLEIRENTHWSLVLFYFEKKDEMWSIKNSLPIWIS